MKKVETSFIQAQYRSGIKNYTDSTRELGLWASEQYVFQQYLKPTDHILDLGCGTGRTTFPLFQAGFQKIIGVDLTPEMITEARKLNAHFGTSIPFEVGDATQLQMESDRFDVVIFSFNGLMSIPQRANRDRALQEIKRVLKADGIFIFTTHDRDCDPKYFALWAAEKERWQQGNQDDRLYEFGDLITSSKNELSEIFIHIPNQVEVRQYLVKNGFEVLETFYRPDKFDESPAVKARSGDCRFWIAKSL